MNKYLACNEGFPMHTVKILKTEFITPDVKRITVERPKGYTFKPGQATDVSINAPGWTDKLRPFSFTNLTTAKHLEFIIKIYDGHDGVTKRIGLLHAGDELLLHAAYGAITYKGPGFFLAAGTGVTPFISILRDLHKKEKLKGCTLLVTNRTAHDVIMEEELSKMLGKHFLRIYTRQNVIGFRERRIDRDTLVTLVQNFDQHFYVCGPTEFVTNINAMLLGLGAASESLVFEQ